MCSFFVLVYIQKIDSVRLQSVVGDLFSVSFQRGGGENKKSLFTREKSGHHVSDAIASCFYLVVFSKRGKNTSRV